MATESTPNPQAHCRLFALPAEIRNDIYSLVLTSPWPAKGALALTPTPRDPSTLTVLSLLQTCRLINDEACGLFYSTHIRVIYRMAWKKREQLHIFTRRTSIKRLSAIPKLTVFVICMEDVSAVFKLLYKFKGLKSLHLLHGVQANWGVHLIQWENLQKDFACERRFLAAAAQKLPRCLSIAADQALKSHSELMEGRLSLILNETRLKQAEDELDTSDLSETND
ncbi:hypothetical protein LTR37_011276 [Vermiconidia calcicola]|uniref:Uncharacterized protein n=1 Tax=Vermiconidia calcicola TaxID=1690605 RepID=A0ACC3N2S7_9PEZI|nr:hypothetical protein LTR37_011276 [Vermiconidia calcicola]